MSHVCPIAGCKTVIANDKLMCFDHWRLVPRSLQQRVTATWQGVRRCGHLAKRLEAIKRYNDARTAAVAAVQKAAPLC